jgi:surface protein
MKKIHGLLAIIALVFIASSCEDKYPDVEDGIYVEIQTNKGIMFAQLYYEEAPVSSANFIALAEGKHPLVNDSLKGKPFYDGLIFHRVMKDFMIQGGDPLANGTGGPGYKFDDEFTKNSLGELKYSHDGAGVLSMANGGPASNGSQFFITHKKAPWLDLHINGSYLETLDLSALTFFEQCVIGEHAVTTMSRMFSSCYSLQSVPLFDTSSVTTMSLMFQHCYSLQSVPLFDTSSVTTMSNIFTHCYSLGRAAFSGTEVDISYLNCNLGPDALDEIYTNLATLTDETITVTGNWGTASDDPTIATAKNWTVTG